MRNPTDFCWHNFHHEQSHFLESDSNYHGNHFDLCNEGDGKARTRTPLLVSPSSKPSFWPLQILTVLGIPALFDQQLSLNWQDSDVLGLDPDCWFAQRPFICSFRSDFKDPLHQKQFILWKITLLWIFLSSGWQFLFAVFSYSLHF